MSPVKSPDETVARLKPQQFPAIRASIKLGRIIRDELPEVAQEYVRGMFASTIVEKHYLCKKYSVNEKLAEEALRRALFGHDGSFRVASYSGLLGSEIREELSRIHYSLNGLTLRTKGEGIFGMSEEESLRASAQGGAAAGKVSYEERRGFHGWSPEKRRIHNQAVARRGGLNSFEKRTGVHAMSEEKLASAVRSSHQARGLTPWREDTFVPEMEFVNALAQRTDYIKTTKGGARRDWKALAGEVNRIYHSGKPVRSAESVSSAYRRFCGLALENIPYMP